jgi:predicted AlkP superfamily phosphohydrolase/phosphomutase
VPLLDSMDYRLDVDAQKAHESIDDFLVDLDQTLDARIEAYRYLWDNQEWQTFMLVFTGTDRLMHFLWDAYDDKDHKHHDSFVRHFRKIDEAIGEIAGKMDNGDQLIMLSDHGFERLEKDVYVNHLLASEGFLTLDPDAEPGLAGISSATKAFALDPGRIFINERGKYPAGSVGPADADACLKDLEDLFASLQTDGRRVMKYIHRKQDVYSGPYLDDAADLILVAEKGFNLKGRISSEELFSKGPFTGKHTYPDAFLLLADGDLADGLPDDASVTDAGKMIQNLVKRQ